MKRQTLDTLLMALDALADRVGPKDAAINAARAHILGIGNPEEVTGEAFVSLLSKNEQTKEVGRLPADVRLVFDRLNDYPELQNGIFIKAWHVIAQRAHDNAQAKGFWEDREVKGKAEQIALMHSELSEALEADRHGDPADPNLPGFNNFAVELADCVIRIMDTTTAYGMPLAEALVAKMRFNASRPAKHGKKY